MSEINRYTFIPSMRTGMAAYTNKTKEHRGKTDVKLNIKARKKGSSTDVEPLKVEKEISVYGPGDILGFDPGIVIRTDPKDNVGDFEPNYFPMIEFADPDFPWRFSLPSSDTVKLNPWITLVVLVAEPNEREFEDKSSVEEGRVVQKIKVTSESAPSEHKNTHG